MKWLYPIVFLVVIVMEAIWTDHVSIFSQMFLLVSPFNCLVSRHTDIIVLLWNDLEWL